MVINGKFGLGSDHPLIQTWLAIGRENPWVSCACDPSFDEKSFYLCRDFNELFEKLGGNWCLGNAFILPPRPESDPDRAENEDFLCFIQQVDGGDEWLTIKGETAFESITARPFSRDDHEAYLLDLVERMQEATEIQCRKLQY